MRILLMARRSAKEILRDPVNLGFGLGFPVVLLLLLTAIQANIPVELFNLDKLTPGIAAFGLAFMALFTAVLVAKDRGSSFLQRLYTTPLTSWEFILGYGLPLIPMGIGQGIICYVVALLLGMEWTAHLFAALLGLIPVALLYVGIGLLCGSVMTDKQAGSLCGALLTNLAAWLSGTWFDLDLVGGAFKKAAYALPFVHGVDLGKALLAGEYAAIWPHLAVVLGYAVVIWAAAVAMFLRQMKKQ